MPDKRDIKNTQASPIESVFNFGSKTNPSVSNYNGNKIYRRAERISAVLYLLTRPLPNPDPLKTRVREEALALLSMSLEVKDMLRSRAEVKDKITVCAHEIMSMLRYAVIAGYISQENAQLTIEAIEDFLIFVKSVGHSFLSEETPIIKTDFSVPDYLIEKTAFSRTSEGANGPVGDAKKAFVNRIETGVKSQRAPHTSRRDVILTLLKKSGPLGIKDVASHLTDCGEKTVQRELSALVNDGILAKEGEKRWSKYRIKG